MLRRNWTYALAIAFTAAILGSALAFEAEDDAAAWDGDREKASSTVVVEHSLTGDKQFTPRCKMTYSSPKTSSGPKAKRTVSVSIDPTKFSVTDLQALKALADAGKHYRVRLPSDVNDANSRKVVASVPACLLITSDFHEIFRVHVDQFGHIRGLWYQTMALECPAGSVAVPSDEVKVVTSVSVEMEARGPKVATEPVPKGDAELGKDKEKEKEKTFFQKYWYYIIGFLLLVMLMGGDDGKAGGGGGGGGG